MISVLDSCDQLNLPKFVKVIYKHIQVHKRGWLKAQSKRAWPLLPNCLADSREICPIMADTCHHFVDRPVKNLCSITRVPDNRNCCMKLLLSVFTLGLAPPPPPFADYGFTTRGLQSCVLFLPFVPVRFYSKREIAHRLPSKLLQPVLPIIS